MQVSTLRPGLLIALKTQISGNVRYKSTEIEAEHRDDYGALVASWETEKTVENPEEHARAVKARSKCRSLITGVCSNTTFGLLCPEAKQNELGDAIGAAQDLAREFNNSASLTRITVGVIVGRVAADDVQAVKAINGEVAELLDRMERGVQALDVEAIRDNANRLREVGSMLTEGASERVTEALKVARSFARRVVKAAETGAAEIDKSVLVTLRSARTAFLDLSDDDAEPISAPLATGRAIDLYEDAPNSVPPITARPLAPVMAFDLD
jgi:hypothetical protein